MSDSGARVLQRMLNSGVYTAAQLRGAQGDATVFLYAFNLPLHPPITHLLGSKNQVLEAIGWFLTNKPMANGQSELFDAA